MTDVAQSKRVIAYRKALADWQAARDAAPGGQLDEDAEAEWMTRCHDIWVRMTEEEAKEVHNG